MLPFLKKMKEQARPSGIIVQERSSQSEQPNDFIEECAEYLIHAIETKDPKSVAFALKTIFEKLDSEPHEEGPHVAPHSYDSQKE